jgi:hypothetical protein
MVTVPLMTIRGYDLVVASDSRECAVILAPLTRRAQARRHGDAPAAAAASYLCQDPARQPFAFVTHLH